jgi:hypothetical protein
MLIQALILAHEQSSIFGELLRNVKGIVFMGTPHRGADIAYWGSFVTDVLRLASLGRNTTSKLLPDLQKGSKTLSEISSQFVHRGSGLNIVTFFEVEIVDFLGYVVSFDEGWELKRV